MPIEPIVQAQDFISYLTTRNRLPNRELIEALDERRFPFSENLFFRHNPSYLGAKEWQRCVDFYLDKTPHGTMPDLSNIMAAISRDEQPHLDELKQLAVKIVRDMYNIPESISLLPEIGMSSSDDLDMNDDEPEELSDEQKEKLKPYVEKRRILNSLEHGAAIHQWVSAFYLGFEELNDMNQNLIIHYDSYASLINYYNWQHTAALMHEMMFNMMVQDGGMMAQGFNRVDFNEEEPEGNIEEQEEPEMNIEIHAQGNNFPVLIHELSKGAICYLLSAGIPNELSADELNYVIEEADKYAHEYWHYYMGPTLWRGLIASANVETQALPEILSYLSKMDYEDLSNLCIEMVFDTEGAGKKAMKKIKKEIASYEQN